MKCRMTNTSFVFTHRFHSQEKLLHCICKRLPALMQTNSIGLIVIDSVAGIYRLENDAITRAASMRKLVRSLQTIAEEHECAVVCVNQVCIKCYSELREINGQNVLHSDIGNSFNERSNTRQMYTKLRSGLEQSCYNAI